MKPNPLRANWELVRLTESALRHGTNGLDSLPGMVKELLTEQAWRSFQLPSGEAVAYEHFTEFVAAGPPRGLGTDIGRLQKLCHDDPVTLDLLDQASQNQTGVHNINTRPQGTSREQALRRLRKDRPDLHAEVLEERLTAHAAMVQAGFRPRTATVPIDDPERLAATLRRRLDPSALARLRELLGEL